MLVGEDVVSLMFAVCVLSILIREILDTLIILYLMLTRGSDVIFGFSTIDSFLLYCSVYHICMLMPF